MLNPSDTILNIIYDLIELSTVVGIQILTIQAMNLAYVVFAKKLFLIQDLRSWNCRPEI